MKQETFTDIEYSYRKKKTKREEFLEIMEEIIPWDEWVGVIEPYYPKGKRGRPPMGIEKMLRMYLLQIWFNLSDPATEDAIYDSYAMRKFTGIDFMTETVPDETTLCKFRHLLETNDLNKLFFDAINRVMVQTGHMMKGGTIVDATIINAPSSTKNAEKKRDPEMHQTKKGNEWKFGMKCHIGVDAGSGLVHTITVTAANEHDITQAAALIREDDEVVYGDAGYLGIHKRPEVACDEHLSSIDYRINRRPGKLPHVSDNAIDWERYIENRKSSVRCKAEHAFRIIKCQFGYKKTVYQRFRRWRDKGIWEKLLEILVDEPDFEWLMIDASHCKVHPHAAGARGGNQDMSRTKGGSIPRFTLPWMQMVCRSEYLSQRVPELIAKKLFT